MAIGNLWEKRPSMASISHEKKSLLLVLVPCLIVFIVISSFVKSVSRKRQIRALGGFAPRVHSWAPFELDLLVTATKHLINNTFFEWTHKLLTRPGHTIEFNIFGRRILFTDAAENIKTIMATNFSVWPKGHHMHAIWEVALGDSIFTTDGEEWLASKALLRPYVAKARPNDLEETEIDFQELKKHLMKPEAHDVYDLADRYQLDVVTRIFLGHSAGSLPATKQEFRVAMEKVFDWNTKRILLGPFGTKVPMGIVAAGPLKIVNEYVASFVDRVKAMSPSDIEAIPENEQNLVHGLIKHGKDPKSIRDQLLAVLTAAKDPSAISIGWNLFELARNPEVAAKLQEEILSVVGSYSVPPTAAQLNEMTYAKCIMRESLRVYASLGYNIRTCSADTTLPVGGGANGQEPVGVLANTQCVYSTLGLQRRKDVWGEDAESWRPERWLNYKPATWDYIPFNHGPRVCMGRNFGQQQILYVLVRIYQEFDRIELVSPKEQQIRVELNTKMAHKCMCKFHPRERSEVEKAGL
ncbi:Cytochrome P450 [Lachnellula subtilissima]|uniref:Cytochrome P450 n=1 Tax=Lachnellula subtilissima TaxID=602034 RepID=A0A8H8RL96_9HELO|nr:Cytochrome P450 [Lachnellula subtilissima]